MSCLMVQGCLGSVYLSTVGWDILGSWTHDIISHVSIQFNLCFHITFSDATVRNQVAIAGHSGRGQHR